MIVGQIRSLRNVGVIGSFSVYVNLLIIFMSMGVVAHSLPNYEVANAANDTLGNGPVIVKAFNSQDLVGQVNGMFKCVLFLVVSGTVVIDTSCRIQHGVRVRW